MVAELERLIQRRQRQSAVHGREHGEFPLKSGTFIGRAIQLQLTRGLRVTHLVAHDNAQEHALNSIARVYQDMLVYDGKTQLGR